MKNSRSTGQQRWGNLEELYERLGPRLRWRAQRLLHDSEEAVEVVQDTFTAFLRAHPTLRGEASHSTVLHGIFFRQVANRLRRRPREALPTSSLGAEGEEDVLRRHEAATAHEGGARQVEALRELVVLIRREHPRALELAYLYLVEGYTFAELGKNSGLGRKEVSKLVRQLVALAQRSTTGQKSSRHPP